MDVMSICCPPVWRFIVSDSVAPDVPIVDLAHGVPADGWSWTLLQQWPAFVAGVPSRDGDTTFRLEHFPRLDDMWTLYALARLTRGGLEFPPAHWEPIASYCRDARRGHVLDEVPVSRSMQAVFAAIRDQFVTNERADFRGLVEEAMVLCACVDTAVAAGADLLKDPIVERQPRLRRYLGVLELDGRTYERDRARGRCFRGELPAEHDRNGVANDVTLLVVDRPTALHFKAWARADSCAPGGGGYDLLLVRDDEGITLSADPRKRLEIGWLAAVLDDVEGADRTDKDARWYDGARHDHTLVGSPRKGTRLGLEEVVAALRAPLSLAPARIHTVGDARTQGRWKRPWLVTMAVGLGVGVLGALAWAWLPRPSWRDELALPWSTRKSPPCARGCP